MPKTRNPGHLAKNFSSAVYAALLADLRRRASTGLPPGAADAVTRWLAAMVDVATLVPDGELNGRKLYQRADDVAAAFADWRRAQGARERDRQLARLRKRVHALATAYRVRTQLLEKQADIELVRRQAEATERLRRALPELLIGVARVLETFRSVLS